MSKKLLLSAVCCAVHCFTLHPSDSVLAFASPPSTSSTELMTPVASLPEESNRTFVNPCRNYSIQDVTTQQNDDHDGVWFRFNGARSSYSDLYDLFYYNQGNSTYTCQVNSNLDESVTNPRLVYDWGWTRAYTGDSYSLDGRLLYGDGVNEQAQQSSPASNACYICGLVRNRRGCFPAGVKIAVDGDGNNKLVEHIAAGDYLWNPILKRSARVLKVVEGLESSPLVALGYGDTVVTVTQKHPVMTQDGIKMAKDLTLADEIYDGQAQAHKLEFVTELPVNDSQRVINFVLESYSKSEDERMVLADGVIVGDMTLQLALDRMAEK